MGNAQSTADSVQARSGSGTVKLDQDQKEKARKSPTTFEPERRARFAARMKVTTAAGRELDEFQRAIGRDRRKRFGWQRTGGSEMTKRGSTSKAIHTPTRANFVSFPHETGQWLSESGSYHRYSGRNRRNRANPYRRGGMRWKRCFRESRSSFRKSGWAIEASNSARRRIGWPLRSTTPYSVATYCT